MYVVDASVWVSYFIKSEVAYTASRSWVARQAEVGVPILGPSHVLAEIAGAVSRRTGHQDLGRVTSTLVSGLPGFRIVAIDQELADLSASVAATLQLRGADAVYVALALLADVPLVTWDKQQLTRGARVAQTLTPEED